MDFYMYGGYSYSVGDPETFPSLTTACLAWVDREDSNGLRRIDGVFFPTWGDMADDDYAITDEYQGWTAAEVRAIARDAIG